MIIVGAAVAVATAFVLLLPTIKTRFPSQLAESMEVDLTYKTLETGNVNVLDSITVTHEDGETYTLLYRNEELYLQREDGDTEIINDSYTSEIIAAATEICVEDTVTEDVSEVSDHLADMGLEPPEITVTVGYANGREVEIRLGDEVPGTTYHYYRWSGDDGVYMCDCGTYEAFEYTAHMLLPVEQPSMAPALIDHVTLNTKTGGEMECAFVSDGENAYAGTLVAPFEYPMDSDAVSTLLNALKNFRLGTKLEAVTTENQAQYGFDDPTSVVVVHQQAGLHSEVDSDGVLQSEQTGEETIRLTFGAKNGDFFYYCQYAGNCYLVSSFLVTTLVNADADDYLSRAPADMGSASVTSIVVQTGGGTLDVRAEYTEHVLENNDIETDSDGNTVYDVSVTANGEAMTTDAFNTLVESLGQMTVSGRLSGQRQPEEAARWQMTLTTAGGLTRTLAAYPMDAFNDLLTVDGEALYYINSEAIRIALAELYPGD